MCHRVHRVFRLICLIAGVRLRKVTGRIPTRDELNGAFIVSNHTMTGDPGLLHFMLSDNARVRSNSNSSTQPAYVPAPSR